MSVEPTRLFPAQTRIQISWPVRIWWVGSSILLALIGWYKTINLLLLVGYILFLLLVINVWLARASVRRIAVSRLPFPPVYPHEPVALSTHILNDSSKSLTVTVTERCESQQSAWLLVPLAPRENKALRSQWVFTERGRYPLDALRADSSFPFGLITVSKRFTSSDEIHVLPPRGRLDLETFRRWLNRHCSGEHHSPSPSRRQAIGSGDVRGVRPFRSGDNRRDVHWKTSARRGELFVREYDRGEPLELVIMVDPWIDAGSQTEEAWLRVEWVLSLAITLGHEWCQHEGTTGITLIVPGSPPVVRSGRPTPGFVRHAFTPLAAVLGSSDVPIVPPDCIPHRSTHAARVLISTRPASPLADSFRQRNLSVAIVEANAQPKWFVPPTNLLPKRPRV